MLKTVTTISGTVTNGTVTQIQGNGTVNGITLTGNVTTSGNLTLGGTLSGVTNAQLQNSAITITGTSVPLGGSISTIPVANVAGAVANTVYVIAGSGLTGGGALTGNVTLTATNTNSGTVTQVQGNGTVNGITLTGNVTSSGNITLGGTLGSIANSQLANSSVTIGNTTVALGSTVTSLGNLTLSNVTIIGGNITDNTITANAFIATESISPALSAGAFSYGTLGYSDVNIFASYSINSNNYAQIILQNINPGGNSSSDFVVSNDKGAANGYYGDFGMNSSGFNGTGSLNLPNATYVYGANSDVVIGTTTANAIHILANGSVTDAITVYANNTAYIANVTIAAGTQNVQTINHTATTNANATMSTASIPLVPQGYMLFDLNGTVVKVPYYAQ